MGRVKNGTVPAAELAEAAGMSPGPARRYLKRLGISSVRREDKASVVAALAAQKEAAVAQGRKKSGEARRGRPRPHPRRRLLRPSVRPFPSPPAPEKSGPCGWRVSILGNRGWIVVRTGTREEMEPWAVLLVRNGIEARASRNEYGAVVSP